jgi:hypothetical protein
MDTCEIGSLIASGEKLKSYRRRFDPTLTTITEGSYFRLTQAAFCAPVRRVSSVVLEIGDTIREAFGRV